VTWACEEVLTDIASTGALDAAGTTTAVASGAGAGAGTGVADTAAGAVTGDALSGAAASATLRGLGPARSMSQDREFERCRPSCGSQLNRLLLRPVVFFGKR
jgi:hypothetical protein